MPVNVRFADGTDKTYRDANAAINKSGFIVLSKWNTKTRRHEEIDVLEAAHVSLAEVVKGGNVTQIVLAARG